MISREKGEKEWVETGDCVDLAVHTRMLKIRDEAPSLAPVESGGGSSDPGYCYHPFEAVCHAV